MTQPSTIWRGESYYLTIMTMTATIRRSESYYLTIMTMTATIGELNPTSIQS